MNDAFLDKVRSFGASDVAVAAVSDGPALLPFAVSIAVRLSDAIIDEIISAPTYTYFNHYRSVNYLIDQILLRTGLALQERGARYITVAASQSQPDSKSQPDSLSRRGSAFEGRYSHKKAACLAGLGTIGANGLFLHREWGSRVRLGTVFTDSAEIGSLAYSPSHAVSGELQPGVEWLDPYCAGCGRCAATCPARAIGVADSSVSGSVVADCGVEGAAADPAVTGRLVPFDPERCSSWMKKEYRDIGRGAVCGICIAVCPRASVQPAT